MTGETSDVAPATAIPSTPLLGPLARLLARVVPPRFVKFCVVGGSGLLVNVAALFVLADLMEVHTNLSAALSIEISIVSNFLLNDRWTFADRRAQAAAFGSRLARFHVVSAVGAAVQWTTFVVGNLALAAMLGLAGPTAGARLLGAILDPPEVGPWKYPAQMLGIALAAVWNFGANLSWTWRGRAGS